MERKSWLDPDLHVFQVSLLKLHTAIGMELAIGGVLRWVVVTWTSYYLLLLVVFSFSTVRYWYFIVLVPAYFSHHSGTQGGYNRRVSSSCSAATCTRVSRNSNHLSGEFALCERRSYHSPCKILLKTSTWVWFWHYTVVHVVTNSPSFVSVIVGLQQHSFYDLIINKARGKSGPVMFNFFKIPFIFLFCYVF